MAQGITTITKTDLAASDNRFEAAGMLTGLEREEAEYLLGCIDLHEKRIKNLDKQIAADSKDGEQIERLKSIPGVGAKTAFAFVAHVAVDRFENSSQASNYLGLVPRVYMSGDTVRHGNITKRGNGYMRALLVQASWALVRSRYGGRLQERYI